MRGNVENDDTSKFLGPRFLQRFLSTEMMDVFLPNIFHHYSTYLDKETTEDSSLIQAVGKKEEQAVTENGEGSKESWYFLFLFFCICIRRRKSRM